MGDIVPPPLTQSRSCGGSQTPSGVIRLTLEIDMEYIFLLFILVAPPKDGGPEIKVFISAHDSMEGCTSAGDSIREKVAKHGFTMKCQVEPIEKEI